MKIETNIEADELIIALVARRNVLWARERAGKPNREAAEAVLKLIDQATAERRALLLEEPKYRYLAVGEIVQKGDEITRHSPYDGTGWAPCCDTIGSKVRRTEYGEFRRRV